MKLTKHGVRKDMGDLKKDVIDTAKTAKEIAKDKLHDVKRGIKNTVKLADENKKLAQKKAEHAANDMKKGSHAVAKDVNIASTRISQSDAVPNQKKQT